MRGIITGIIFSTLLLGGCVGVATDYTISSQAGVVNLKTGDEIYFFDWKGYDKKRTEEYFGKPSEIHINKFGQERWVYPYKKSWKGVYVFLLVIPIPLKLPIGNLNMYIDFKDNNVQNISYEFLTGKFHGCGPGVWLMTGMSEFSGGPKFCI